MKSNFWAKFVLVLLVVGFFTLPFTGNVPVITGQHPLTSIAVTVGPGVPVNVASRAREPQYPQYFNRVIPRYSDVDPATLNRLKSRPNVPPPSAPYERIEAPPLGRTAPSGGPLAPVTLSGLSGPSQIDNANAGFQARPPDPHVAVGPSHVIRVVNLQVLISTFTTPVAGFPQTLASWFGPLVCVVCSLSDPRVAYDPQESHWILTAIQVEFVSNTSSVLLSVSRTSDPTGTWTFYSVNAALPLGPGGALTFADFPDVGFDGILSTAPTSGAVYITSNQFTFAPGCPPSCAFATAALWILPKSALYTGAPSFNAWVVGAFSNSDASPAFTLRTAQTYGNPGGEFLVNTKPTAGGNFVSLWRVVPTYPPTPANITLQATVAIGAYTVPPNAAQPGCPNQLDTGDNRLYNAVWQNNRLYTAFTEAAAGGVSNFRSLKINTSTNAAELNVSAGDGTHYFFYPAIAVDGSDNIVVVFARSGTGFNEFGSIFYQGRRAGAPSADPAVLLQGGVQCITGVRWGDYFGAAVEPVGFKRVWVYGQWASNLAGIIDPPVWNWDTRAGALQFDVRATVGLYNPSTSVWLLRNSNTSGFAEITFPYGPGGAGWTPVVGAWTGGKVARVGLYDPMTGTWYLRNSATTGFADTTFTYGPAGRNWIPVVGDWTGNGTKTPGLYDPATGIWYLRNSNDTGIANIQFGYGPAGRNWIPVVGDWTGQGRDTVGLYDPATSTWYLRNSNDSGIANIQLGYGPGGAGWTPVVGDWTGQGRDTVGLYDPATGIWYLRNSNDTGIANIQFGYGPAGLGWRPRVGNW